MKGRCMTCEHWAGDGNKETLKAEANPAIADLYSGWTEADDCYQAHFWMNIEIQGNATATVTVNSNFGCIYWEPRMENMTNEH